MKKIDVYIDRLVLHGFGREDRHGIAAGLQQELIRMFSDPQTAQWLMPNDGVSRLRTGDLQIGQGASPQYVGTQVARVIGKGIGK